jgi:hypothetical protein
MEKTCFGGPKEIKTSFFRPVKELLFSLLVLQKKFFFPFGALKEKKIAQGV